MRVRYYAENRLSNYCGLNAHRNIVYACIAVAEKKSYRLKELSLFYLYKKTSGVLSWLLLNNCKDVCMKSTGKY